MAHVLRTLIEDRAGRRCEYCRCYQEFMGRIFFEMEHIVPRAHEVVLQLLIIWRLPAVAVIHSRAL